MFVSTSILTDVKSLSKRFVTEWKRLSILLVMAIDLNSESSGLIENNSSFEKFFPPQLITDLVEWVSIFLFVAMLVRLIKISRDFTKFLKTYLKKKLQAISRKFYFFVILFIFEFRFRYPWTMMYVSNFQYIVNLKNVLRVKVDIIFRWKNKM